MPIVNPDRCRLLKILAYVALVATFAALGYVLATHPSALSLPTNDCMQYWAARRLNLHGFNPSDSRQMLALERSAGRALDIR